MTTDACPAATPLRNVPSCKLARHVWRTLATPFPETLMPRGMAGNARQGAGIGALSGLVFVREQQRRYATVSFGDNPYLARSNPIDRHDASTVNQGELIAVAVLFANLPQSPMAWRATSITGAVGNRQWALQ